jgi:radical SAM superfamily enzyme YgiQ (UPF0313 family)
MRAREDVENFRTTEAGSGDETRRGLPASSGTGDSTSLGGDLLESAPSAFPDGQPQSKRRVALFEFPTRAGIAPLATAYLQSFALKNERVRDNYAFTLHVHSVGEEDVLNKVLAVDADIYGLSVYVWNSRLVRRIVDALIERRPTAQIIIGGPQVMHGAASYLRQDCDRLLLCNGEGEHTFTEYLVVMLDEEPALAQVKGLSFYNDGILTTTEASPRIRELDEIPSPFLNGLIDADKYSFVSFETNRGCPFKCTYCFWGGATNAKVHKFGEDRVLDEIDWIANNGIEMVFLIDANFGMLPRDLEIAQHLVDCKKRTGFPKTIFINSSKNTPERVIEITRMWHEVGLIAAQPVSMQTANADVLKAVERDNIKDSTYTELQRTLNTYGMQSFLEMIWPLPGETLKSFREGLDSLCRMRSDSFVVYPLMLINNVKMSSQRELYGLQTTLDPDPNSEAEIVVATSTLSNEEYQSGIKTSYHMTVLFTFMGLRHTMDYIDQTGGKTYTQIADAFWQCCETMPETPYTEFVNRIDSMAGFNLGAGGLNATGGAIHAALFVGTKQFDLALYRLAAREGWLGNEDVRLRFEIDLLNRPMLYANSAIPEKQPYLSILSVEDRDRDTLTVRVPARHAERLAELLSLDVPVSADDILLRINYRSPGQLPFSNARPLHLYHLHCLTRTRGDIRSIAPQWSLIEREMDERLMVPREIVRG